MNDDDVVDLDAQRSSRRRRRTGPPRRPAEVTPFPGRAINSPDEAIIHLLVQTRLRRDATDDDQSRTRHAHDIETFALAAGAVLHPRDPDAAHTVRDRLLAAVRNGTTDTESLLRIAHGDDDPPDAG